MKRLASLFVTSLFFLFSYAQVPGKTLPGEKAITARLTKYHVRSSHEKQFREALSQYVLSALDAPGNIMAEAYYEEEDPSRLWMIERWSGRDVLAANDAGAGKLVGAICHAPVVLATADILKGKKLTGYWNVHTDLINAGGQVSDEPVVVDGNLITSRHPIDVADFSRAVADWLVKH